MTRPLWSGGEEGWAQRRASEEGGPWCLRACCLSWAEPRPPRSGSLHLLPTPAPVGWEQRASWTDRLPGPGQAVTAAATNPGARASEGLHAEKVFTPLCLESRGVSCERAPPAPAARPCLSCWMETSPAPLQPSLHPSRAAGSGPSARIPPATVPQCPVQSEGPGLCLSCDVQ